MPGGKRWLTTAPSLRMMPSDLTYWHVYHVDYAHDSANPYSTGRMALIEPEGAKPSAFGMFYVASDFAGALWEVVLRYVEPDANRRVRVDTTKLAGMRVARLRLIEVHVPMLELGQPGLRTLFSPDSKEAQAVAKLLVEPDTHKTHAETRRLRADLVRAGVTDMPVLSWPSRQHSTSTVYLAYAPPMIDDAWALLDVPQPLDTQEGFDLIRAELARCGFHWDPLDTDAVMPDDE